MNNAKLWLVVSPTVGIPLFLSAVALSSFAVHLAVITKAPNVLYYGPDGGESAETASLAPAEGDTKAAKLAGAPLALGEGAEVLITMPDGTTARAVLQAPVTEVSMRSPDTPLLEH